MAAVVLIAQRAAARTIPVPAGCIMVRRGDRRVRAIAARMAWGGALGMCQFGAWFLLGHSMAGVKKQNEPTSL